MKNKWILTVSSCLWLYRTEAELSTEKWKKGYNDAWPVERVYALN